MGYVFSFLGIFFSFVLVSSGVFFLYFFFSFYTWAVSSYPLYVGFGDHPVLVSLFVFPTLHKFDVLNFSSSLIWISQFLPYFMNALRLPRESPYVSPPFFLFLFTGGSGPPTRAEFFSFRFFNIRVF